MQGLGRVGIPIFMPGEFKLFQKLGDSHIHSFLLHFHLFSLNFNLVQEKVHFHKFIVGSVEEKM